MKARPWRRGDFCYVWGDGDELYEIESLAPNGRTATLSGNGGNVGVSTLRRVSLAELNRRMTGLRHKLALIHRALARAGEKR